MCLAGSRATAAYCASAPSVSQLHAGAGTGAGMRTHAGTSSGEGARLQQPPSPACMQILFLGPPCGGLGNSGTQGGQEHLDEKVHPLSQAELTRIVLDPIARRAKLFDREGQRAAGKNPGAEEDGAPWTEGAPTAPAGAEGAEVNCCSHHWSAELRSAAAAHGSSPACQRLSTTHPQGSGSARKSGARKPPYPPASPLRQQRRVHHGRPPWHLPQVDILLMVPGAPGRRVVIPPTDSRVIFCRRCRHL